MIDNSEQNDSVNNPIFLLEIKFNLFKGGTREYTADVNIKKYKISKQKIFFIKKLFSPITLTYIITFFHVYTHYIIVSNGIFY